VTDATRDPSPGDGRLSTFAERLSDRVNPIFLRELQQAFNARTFTLLIAVALGANFFITLMVALRADAAFASGRQVFVPVMMVLVPLLTMVLPMQAFNSMQHELREGAVDQLLMSELTPRRIVRGKLMAAGLLAVVFVSLFAPMLAVTYLLRGIDVATIGICLGFGLLVALAAASVGMAMGAVTMIKPLQQLARIGVSLALAALTIALMASLFELVRELSRLRPGDLEAMAVSALGLVVGIVLMNLIAAAVLTHPYENRSTPFRVFLAAVVVFAYAIAYWIEPAHVAEFAIVWPLLAGVGATPFYLGALTEAPQLSPRVRTLVPRNRLLALAAAPFLPGGDRALLFVFVLLAGLGGGAAIGMQSARGVPNEVPKVVAMTLCYVWIWACILRVLRGDGPGQRPRVRAMVALLALFALATAGPMIVDLAATGSVDTWSLPHVLNPFFTIGDHRGRNGLALGVLVACSLALLLLRVPKMARGVREVMEASRARPR